MPDRAGKILAIESRGAGQRQGLQVVRVELERLFDQARRFTLEAAAIRRRQRIGVVGHQHGVVGAQAQGMFERRHRFVMSAEYRIRAPEHGPAVGVVGLVLQARGQGFEHGFDLLARDRVAAFAGGRLSRSRLGAERLGRAQPGIARAGDQQHERGQGSEHAFAGVGGWRGRGRRAHHHIDQAFFQHPARFAVGHVGQGTTGMQGRKLLDLPAQCGKGGVRRGRRAGARAPPQRARQQGQRQQRQQRADGQKRDHVSFQPLSADSNFSGARRARRRSTTISAVRPATSSTAGPSQSSTVVAFSGGR